MDEHPDHRTPRDWTGASEEPPAVRTDNGLRHLPEVRARAFLGLLRAGQQLDQVLDGELREAHGIGLRGFEVLLHLAVFAPERQLPMTRLAAQTPLSQSRTSRLVADLESRGLVTRERSTDDSRAVDVRLTDRGQELFQAAQDTHLAGLDRHLYSRLTWDQVTQLATITHMILAGGGKEAE